MMQAVALQLFILVAQLSSADDSKLSEASCYASSSTFYTRTCCVPEHSTVVLRVPEGAGTWFKQSTDSPRSLCVGSERCVLPRATREDAGLYYAAVQLGPSGSASLNNYFVKLDVMIPPVLQNVVECDSSGTSCWTATTAYYWQDAQFTISVAYIGVGRVTWTRSTYDGSYAPFTCGSTPTHCTMSNSTYQMVHYVNITFYNPYDPSEQNAVYRANVTNEAGFNASSTQVNLLCSSPDPPSSVSSISLEVGTVGKLTCLADVDPKYQINVCYTSVFNWTNCSACQSWSEGTCSPMPGKPHWTISSTVSTNVYDCKQMCVSVIIDSVQEDDTGTVNYYLVAVTPKLYQTYLLTVDTDNTKLWVKLVVGGSVATFLLIVVGIVISLCTRRGKGKLLPESGQGQIQSETQPLLVETETAVPTLVVSHSSTITAVMSHPPVQSPQHQISMQHPTSESPQHPPVVPPQHPSAISPQLPTAQHPLVVSSQLQTPQQPAVALSGFTVIRSDSIVSQPTSHVSLVPEDGECVEEV